MPSSQRTSGKSKSKSKKPDKPSEQSSPSGGAGADADNWWEKSDLDSAEEQIVNIAAMHESTSKLVPAGVRVSANEGNASISITTEKKKKKLSKKRRDTLKAQQGTSVTSLIEGGEDEDGARETVQFDMAEVKKSATGVVTNSKNNAGGASKATTGGASKATTASNSANSSTTEAAAESTAPTVNGASTPRKPMAKKQASPPRPRAPVAVEEEQPALAPPAIYHIRLDDADEVDGNKPLAPAPAAPAESAEVDEYPDTTQAAFDAAEAVAPRSEVGQEPGGCPGASVATEPESGTSASGSSLIRAIKTDVTQKRDSEQGQRGAFAKSSSNHSSPLILASPTGVSAVPPLQPVFLPPAAGDMGDRSKAALAATTSSSTADHRALMQEPIAPAGAAASGSTKCGSPASSPGSSPELVAPATAVSPANKENASPELDIVNKGNVHSDTSRGAGGKPSEKLEAGIGKKIPSKLASEDILKEIMAQEKQPPRRCCLFGC